ncbi:uncharacterized protein JCM10292_005481 [Rhodotorula paludigena]|uniref:uncharacterized protein n=1 Tax=Rhodotorula paludigena TaxID=86838 RepID=UPI0031771B61
MSATTAARASVPRYRAPALASRLPPPKLPLFRSVVAHPPAPFAVEANTRAKAQEEQEPQAGPAKAGKGQGKASAKASAASTGSTNRPLVGPHQVLYSPAPRPLIPLTASPFNHKLWNPPAPDSAQTRSIDKDESGRLARFSSRFGGAAPAGEDSGTSKKGEEALYGIEGDLSWLEGVTAQSPGTALGKRDVVGPAKKEKKGKK